MHPSCYWALVPHPPASTTISAPWSLPWLLLGTGALSLASFFPPLWALDRCIPHHLRFMSLAHTEFATCFPFLCQVAHGLGETHWPVAWLNEQTSLVVPVGSAGRQDLAGAAAPLGLGTPILTLPPHQHTAQDGFRGLPFYNVFLWQMSGLFLWCSPKHFGSFWRSQWLKQWGSGAIQAG